MTIQSKMPYGPSGHLLIRLTVSLIKDASVLGLKALKDVSHEYHLSESPLKIKSF